MELKWNALRGSWRDRGTDVYLSPHADDVCFSLGGMLARSSGGILITVFTRSRFAPGLRFEDEDAMAREHAITSARASEDRKFCQRASMTLVRLGLPEPRVRGQSPRGYPNSQELGDVGRALTPLLGLAGEASPRRTTLYAPAGIGEHRDHIAVALFILANRCALAQGFRLRFYEDLPYAATFAQRAHNEAVRAHLRLLGFERQLRDFIWEEKIELLKCYPSQLDGEPAKQHFSVVAQGNAEAWWEAAQF